MFCLFYTFSKCTGDVLVLVEEVDCIKVSKRKFIWNVNRLFNIHTYYWKIVRVNKHYFHLQQQLQLLILEYGIKVPTFHFLCLLVFRPKGKQHHMFMVGIKRRRHWKVIW